MKNFYEPAELAVMYEQIIPAYQEAFADEPWCEVTKCPEQPALCPGGFSVLEIGKFCQQCRKRPTEEAYSKDELIDRFELMAETRPTLWYVEQFEERISLAAVSWVTTARNLWSEKYRDVPEMLGWLEDRFTDQEFVWLDEVFANKKVRASGNLANFKAMIDGFSVRLGDMDVAYRTITPQMTTKPRGKFGDRAKIMQRESDLPDRRDFVVIERSSK